MACCTTMKHMCSWGGSNSRCSRCGDSYCNYHKAINMNPAGSGGHICACAEGKKNAAYAIHCKGNFQKCGCCGQKVCHYHAPPNKNGVVGGHGGCSGSKCKVVIGGFSCGGAVSKCNLCEYEFCANHMKPGLENGINGHACDIGCDTTNHTKVNCSGRRRDLKPCKFCKLVDNDYKYCNYHLTPVEHLLELKGGHVCQGYTTGSMLFGDSVGDFVSLACEAAVTVVTAGAVNPAAATIASNAMKIAVNKLLEVLGLTKLVKLVSTIQSVIDLSKAAKKKHDDKLKKDAIVKAVRALKDMADTLKQIKGLGSAFEKAARAIDNGNSLDDVVAVLEAAVAVIDLAKAVKAAYTALVDASKKVAGVVNPIKCIEAVKATSEAITKFNGCNSKVEAAVKVLGK